jgi:hypothetical protein
LLGLMVQALIPYELPKGGLDDRRIRNFKEGEEISKQELTRMLKISLDHYDLLKKRVLAYEVANEKFKSRVKKLHDLLQKKAAGGRSQNKILRELAESEARKYFEKHDKHLTAQMLSKLVSIEVFKQDPQKYKDISKKKWRKLFPKTELPAEWDRATNWNFFEFYYRPISVRTASNWLKEIKEAQTKKI